MKNIPLSVVSVGLMAVAAQAHAGVQIKVVQDNHDETQVQAILKALSEKGNSEMVFQNTPEIAKALSENGKVLDISVDSNLTGNKYHSSLTNTARSNNLSSYNNAKTNSDTYVNCHCHNNCHVNCHSNCHSSRSWR